MLLIRQIKIQETVLLFGSSICQPEFFRLEYIREGYDDVATNCVLYVQHDSISDPVSTFQIVSDRDLAPETVILFLY